MFLFLSHKGEKDDINDFLIEWQIGIEKSDKEKENDSDSDDDRIIIGNQVFFHLC